MGMQFIRELLGLSGLGFPVNNVQDEACPDFETLQIRTTVWRSIPLAMISLYMAARSLIEMPLSRATSFFWGYMVHLTF
eukprot:g27757.t1